VSACMSGMDPRKGSTPLSATNWASALAMIQNGGVCTVGGANAG